MDRPWCHRYYSSSPRRGAPPPAVSKWLFEIESDRHIFVGGVGSNVSGIAQSMWGGGRGVVASSWPMETRKHLR